MEAPVSVWHGAMRPLSRKLDALLHDSGCSLQQGEKNKILGLKEHLDELWIRMYLMELLELDASALTANCWAKNVRDLSYDIDDFIDELVHVDAADKIVGGKITKLRKGFSRRRWVADEISGFRTRMKEAIERYKIYSLHQCKRRSGITTSSEEHGALHPSRLIVVGMESSMEKVGGWLTDDDADKQLRVVSIVGIGGVGKTTLATQLYSKHGGRFECRAFVRASRKPDMRSLLTSLLLQVRGRHQPLDAADYLNNHIEPVDDADDVDNLMEPLDAAVDNLIDEIRACLQDKKYFIIIDDLWASSTWDIVYCALPNGNCCSRILTTTELDAVAQRCCARNSNYMLDSNRKDSEYIFKLEPLSDDGSRQLLFSRAFGHQENCPEQLRKVSDEIIKRCGGLPLAIITVASVLTIQPYTVDQLNYIQNSLGFNLWINPTLEGMKQVLSLCYNNLPHHLKTCMLYLSICKEDYVVCKDDLVKQWIAEGFIGTVEGNKDEEVAGNYFNDLVNRGMIQPVDISYSGEVLSCIVHYMVLSFLRYKSIQENFMTAIDHSQTEVRLVDKVRNLSLHFGSAEDATTPVNMRLSQVRSLVFSGLFKCVPSIAEFKLLKVLFLQLWFGSDGTSYDLNKISIMFRLRYLHIDACHLSLELPEHMQPLKDLMTMKIYAKVSSIPSDITQMQGLLHLHLPGQTNLPDNIGDLTSLQSLGYYNLSSNSKDNVLSLGQLINLWDLRLTCCTVEPNNIQSNMECLGSILGKLINLRSITLVNTLDDAGSSTMSISCDGLSTVSPAPVLLQKIELLPQYCIFSSLPKWIGTLDKLCILKIGLRGLSLTDIYILGGLPALTALSLYVHKALAKRIIIGRAAGFSVLKYFKFRCSVPLLTFEAGAMPNLWKLKLGLNGHTADQDGAKSISIERLPDLKEICVKIGGASVDAETVLVTTIVNHPSNPRINVKSVDWDFHGEQDPSRAAVNQGSEITEENPDEYHGIQDENSGANESRTPEERDEANTRASTSSGSSSRFSIRGATSKLRNVITSCSSGSHASAGSVPPTPRSEGEILEAAKVKAFTFNELRVATRNFRPDSVLGEGGFGSVFKGWIDEKTLTPTKPGTGMVIAVKKLNQEGYQGHREWLAEVNYLGQLSHPNLVKLVGYCVEDEQRLLVYEFMPRGSLENHLFRRSTHFQPLSWNLRMKIALGAAKGLAFLHSDKAKVIYRDFKTSNILLDANYDAKLSDFGLAKDGPTGDKSHVSTRVMGTYGYAAPEYLATGHLTTKSDVYSYGVVLLEMLSGRRALDKNRPNGEHNLVEWARPYLRSKRRIFRILDARLGGQYSLAKAQKAAALALQCLSMESRHRPAMDEVVTTLEQLQDAKEAGTKTNPQLQKKSSNRSFSNNSLKPPTKEKPASPRPG